jgi:hypothetical protein
MHNRAVGMPASMVETRTFTAAIRAAVRPLTGSREDNDSLGPEQQIGFYSIDLYSLHRSIAAAQMPETYPTAL